MDILGQSALVVAVTSFSLGMSVFSKNVKNKLFRAYGLLSTVIAAWALFFFLEKIWPVGTFYSWHLFFNVWVGPVGLFFVRLFLKSDDVLGRRLLDFSVLVGVVLSAALVIGIDDYPWIRLAIYFAPVLVGVEILWQMVVLKRVRRINRARWIYLGGLLALCTSTMDHIPELGRGLPAFGNIALTTFLFFLSQAILQQRLLNFGALFSRFLVLLGIGLILTAMYSVLVAWISDSPELFFLNSFIASFLILTLLDPLRTLVAYLTDRLLSPKQLSLKNLLRESQRRLTGITELGALFGDVLQFSEQVFSPDRASLFLLRRDETRFRRIRFLGHEGEKPLLRELLADHPIIEACMRLRRKGELPILLDVLLEGEIERSTSRAQQELQRGLIEGLKGLGGNLLIPLLEGGKILGFVILQVTEPPDPWGSNWGFLNIVYPYYEQAARTLVAMEIFTKSRERDRLAALGEMAAGLAHEIRNPLGAIKGAAQLLDPSIDRPESAFLKIILEEVDRLNRVVTQFLDYSKPSLLDAKPVQLEEMIKKTLELLQPAFSEKVKVTFSNTEKQPVTVLGAFEQLQQVLINLVQNSMKALDGQRDPEIRIFLEKVSDQEAALSVEDNGVGIKKENLEKLFIPFFTTSPSGTGLGLPISQKIVEAHKGRIEVQSEENQYTRFSILLPVVEQKV